MQLLTVSLAYSVKAHSLKMPLSNTFFIHHQTADRRGTALQCQMLNVNRVDMRYSAYEPVEVQLNSTTPPVKH